MFFLGGRATGGARTTMDHRRRGAPVGEGGGIDWGGDAKYYTEAQQTIQSPNISYYTKPQQIKQGAPCGASSLFDRCLLSPKYILRIKKMFAHTSTVHPTNQYNHATTFLTTCRPPIGRPPSRSPPPATRRLPPAVGPGGRGRPNRNGPPPPWGPVLFFFVV